MFRRQRASAPVHVDEVRGVRTHAQRAEARIDSERTRAMSLGIPVH